MGKMHTNICYCYRPNVEAYPGLTTYLEKNLHLVIAIGELLNHSILLFHWKENTNTGRKIDSIDPAGSESSRPINLDWDPILYYGNLLLNFHINLHC